MSTEVMTVVRRAEGGIKRHILSLVDHIDKDAYNICVGCESGSALAKELAARQVITFPLDISSAIRPWNDTLSIIKLNAVFHRYKPSIVHVHGVRPWQIAAVSLHGVPIVASIHNFPYKDGRIMKASYKMLAARTARIIAVSDALAEYLCSCGISQDKIAVVYNGVNIRYYDNIDTGEYHKEGGFVIGTAARLIPQKGIDVLLEAFYMLLHKYNNAKLVIAGDGPSRMELERWCWEMNIADRVSFLGYISDINAFMQRLDVFVLPSLSEGFGISVLEAMACAKPVIASSVGGVPEIIDHGRTGLLFPPGDSGTLAMYLEYLIEHKKEAIDMGLRARRRLDGHFDVRTMVKKIEGIYRSLI
ncbi:glycosyltransferase family 4 protein [Mahella sp.]|uniref:glycosyltransferase family 4 protein n=1 Tax=Mahella sp. TaxID=2798721 RepID=UPI0025C3BDBE|nr:glycosyltransferase family 4 protein [Mahella sp.]MBZ4664797.1 glycosyl transferase group 1 [Mahella sp.]